MAVLARGENVGDRVECLHTIDPYDIIPYTARILKIERQQKNVFHVTMDKLVGKKSKMWWSRVFGGAGWICWNQYRAEEDYTRTRLWYEPSKEHPWRTKM